jgi:hypothetical protein
MTYKEICRVATWLWIRMCDLSVFWRSLQSLEDAPLSDDMETLLVVV